MSDQSSGVGPVRQPQSVAAEDGDTQPQNSAKRDLSLADGLSEDVLGQHWGSADQLLETLKDVVDPELGVNIVDLGLVYGVDIDAEGRATIDLTLTSPACPLTDQLENDVRYLLSSLTSEVTINWVWLPPWSLDMITDDGREQLRALGFNM
jgi:metal-sulfur cluster biosynthetic enzyme